MKTKYLSSLLTTTALALGMNLVFGVSTVASEQVSTVASEQIFACQSNGREITTVAQTNDSEGLPVFHWNRDAIPNLDNPQQLCDSVSQKLNDYLAEGNDLSSVTFKAQVVMGLPAICVAGKNEQCDRLLFTLKPAAKPDLTANNALAAILDKDLQTSSTTSASRGYQSTSYNVNLWQLLFN